MKEQAECGVGRYHQEVRVIQGVLRNGCCSRRMMGVFQQ